MADWVYYGPGGRHDGAGAADRAGRGSVGVCITAATLLEGIVSAEKPGEPTASERRYNAVTSAFHQENAKRKKDGRIPLDDHHRLAMETDAERWLEFARAHRNINRAMWHPWLQDWWRDRLDRARSLSGGALGRFLAGLRRAFAAIWRFLTGHKWGAPGQSARAAPGVAGYSECPGPLMTHRHRHWKQADTETEAREMLVKDPTKLEFIVVGGIDREAYVDCGEPPTASYSVGPYVAGGARAGAKCACQALHTFDQRCARGIYDTPDINPQALQAVADHLRLYTDPDDDDAFLDELRRHLPDAPKCLSEYAMLPKWRRKFGRLAFANRIEPEDSRATSSLIIKTEKLYNDSRGRLVVNANATFAATMMGLHTDIISVFKYAYQPDFQLRRSLFDREPVPTSGASWADLRARFNRAAEAGFFYGIYNDISAAESRAAAADMAMLDTYNRCVDWVVACHPGADVRLAAEVFKKAVASARSHTMTYDDRRGWGARRFKVLTYGYFITGWPLTTFGNTILYTGGFGHAIEQVVEARGQDEQVQLSTIGDDGLCLAPSEDLQAAVYGNLIRQMNNCGFLCKAGMADMRDSPSRLIYNQRHIVWHGEMLHIFQNPARLLNYIGITVNPNCSDPVYLRGAGAACVISAAVEYDGHPIGWAYARAGLEYYGHGPRHSDVNADNGVQQAEKPVRPVFEREQAYWVGRTLGSSIDPRRLAASTLRSRVSCSEPSDATREAYHHAFPSMSPARQLEVEACLVRAWTSSDWCLPRDVFVDVWEGDEL